MFFKRVLEKNFTLGDFDKDGVNFQVPLIKSKLNFKFLNSFV